MAVNDNEVSLVAVEEVQRGREFSLEEDRSSRRFILGDHIFWVLPVVRLPESRIRPIFDRCLLHQFLLAYLGFE